MQTTAIVLATGRTYEARGTYDEIKALLATRSLSADDGLRELLLTDGERVTISKAAVAEVRAVTARKRNPIGFR